MPGLRLRSLVARRRATLPTPETTEYSAQYPVLPTNSNSNFFHLAGNSFNASSSFVHPAAPSSTPHKTSLLGGGPQNGSIAPSYNVYEPDKERSSTVPLSENILYNTENELAHCQEKKGQSGYDPVFSKKIEGHCSPAAASPDSAESKLISQSSPTSKSNETSTSKWNQHSKSDGAMLYSSLHQDEGRQPEIMHQIRPIADKDNVTANSVQGLLPFVQPTALIGPESSKDDKQKELLNVIMHQDGQKLNSSQLPSSAQNACGNLKVNSVQEQQILSQNQPTLPEPVLEEQPSKQNGSLHCTKPLPPQQSQEQQVHAMRDRHTQSPKLHHQSIHPMQQQKELQAEQHLQRSLQMQQQSQTKNIQPMQQHNQPQAVQQMQLSLQTQNQSQQQQLLQQHPQYQHQAQILQSSHLLQQDLQQVQIQSHYQAVQSHHQSIESQHQQIQSQHLHIQSQQQQDQVMSQQGIQQTQQMTIYPRTAYSAPPPTAFTPNVYPHAALQGGLIYNPSLMTTPTNNQQAAAAYLSLNTGSQAALGYNSFGTSGTSLFLLPSQSTVSPYSQAAQTHSYLLPSQSFSQPTLQTHYLAQPTQLMTAQPQQILFPQQSYPSQTQNAYHSSLYPPTAYAAYSTSGYPNSTYQSSTHAYITPFQATVPDVNQQTIAGQTIALQPTISLQAVSQPSLGINPSSVSSVGSNGCLASVLQAMPQQAITSLPSSIVNPSLHGAGAGSAVVQGTASGSTIVPGANALIIQGNNTTTSLSRAVIHGSVNASAMLPGSNAPSSSVSMPVVQQFSTGTAVVITTTQPMNTAVNSSTSGHISIAPRIGPVQTEIKTSSPARRRGTKKSAAIAPALKKINSRKLPVGEDRVLSTANSISNIISLSDSVSMTLVSSTSNSTCVPLTSLCNVVPNSFATSIVVPELQILSKSSSPGFQSDLSSRVEATYAGDKIEAAEPFDLLLQLDALESMQKSLTKETIRSYDAILHETPNFNINEPAPEVNPITSTCSQNTLETQLAPATASPVSSSHLDDSGSAELQVQVIKTEPESPAEAESELKIVENDPVENPIAEDSSDLFLLEEVNAVPGSTSISEELCVSKTKSEMSKKGAAACLKTPEKKMSNPRSCELSSSELDCKQSTSDEANLPIAHAASESTSDIAYMRLEKEVLATVAFDALESLSHRKDLNVEKLPASVGAEVEDRSCGVLNISESVLSVDESTAYASEKSKSESNSQTLNCQMLSPGKSSEHVDDLVSLKSIDENISVDSKFKDLNQSPSFENSEKSNKHDESKVPLIEEIISLASDKKKVDSNTDNSVADVNPVRDLYLDASKSNCTLTSKLSDSDSIVANLDDSKMSLITPAVTDENDASFIHTDPEVSEMTVQDGQSWNRACSDTLLPNASNSALSNVPSCNNSENTNVGGNETSLRENSGERLESDSSSTAVASGNLVFNECQNEQEHYENFHVAVRKENYYMASSTESGHNSTQTENIPTDDETKLRDEHHSVEDIASSAEKSQFEASKFTSDVNSGTYPIVGSDSNTPKTVGNDSDLIDSSDMNNAVIPSLTQYPVTDEPDLNSTSVNRNKKFPFQDLDSVCTGELAHKDASDLDLCDPQSDENRVGHAQVNLTKIEEAAGVEGDLLISNPVDRLHAVIPDLRKLTSSTASTALEENDEVENKNKCVPGRTLESVADAPEISSAFCGESRDDESIPEEVSKDSKRWAKFTQIDKKASNKTLPYKLSVDSKTSPLRGVENSRPRTRLRMLRLGTVGGAAKLKSPIKSPRSRMIRNFLDSGKRLTSSSGMRRLVTTRGGLLVEKSSQLFNSSANSKFSPRKSSSDTYEDFSKRREERLRDVRICRSGNPTPRESVQSIKVSPSKRSTQECASSTERIVIKMKLLSPNLKDQNSNASETPSCITTAPTKGSTSSEWTIDRDVRTNALVSLPKFSPSSGKWKSETVKEGELKMKLKQEKPDSDVYNFDEREGEKFPLDNTSYTSCGRSIDPEGKENSVGFRNKVCYSNVTDSESEHASRRSSADSCSGNSAVDSRRSSQCSDTSDASEATDVSSCASSQTSLVSSGSEKGVQIVFKKLQDSEGYSCFRTKKKRLDFGVQKIPEVVEEEQLEPRTKSSEETKMVETPLDKLESPDNEPPVSKSPLSVILPSSLLDGEKKSGQLEDISPESVDLLTTSVPGVGTKMDVKHPHDIVEELLNSSSPSNSPYQEASNCQVHVETSKVKESVRASMECSDGRITKEFESSNLLSVKCEQEKEKKPGTDGSCRPKRRAALVSQEKSMLALSKLETKSSSKIFETRAVDAAEVIVEACQEVEPVVERCRRRPRSRNLDLLHLRTNVTASYKREASVSPDKIDSKRKKLRESLTLSLKCPSDKTGNDGTNTISPTAKISASLTIDGDEANEAGSKTSSLIVEEQSTKLVNVIEHEKCGSNQDPKVTASHEDSTLHVNPSTSLTVLSLPTSCDVSSSPNLVAPDLTDEKELVSTCPGNTGESLYNETVIECCVSLSNVFYDCKLNILSCPGCSKSITPKGIVVDTAAHMMHILCFSCDWLVVRKLSSIEV